MRRALLALLLVVAACSSGGDDDASAPASAPSSTEAADVEARPSAGCEGTGSPAPGQTEERLISGGVERTYIRTVPDAEGPLPLVVDFHGYSEGAAIHVQLSGLPAHGEEEGFVTLVPWGLGDPVRWDVALDSPDLDFAGDLLDEAERTLCIDLARVYVTGLSNGAFMASSVACRYADRVAAVAPVAGVQDPEGCDPDRRVPLLAVHGTADQFVSYDGGLGERALDLIAPDGSGRTLRETGATELPKGPSVPEIVEAWAARNGCERGEPDTTSVGEDVDRLAHDCPEGADVELYRVEGGGHAWPGSEISAAVEGVVGFTTMTVSANELMWAFFEEHPLPAG